MTDNFLFIGAIGSEKTIRELNAKGFNVSTAYNVQKKILAGLEENGKYCDTITGHTVVPSLKKLEVIRFSDQNRNDKVTDISVSFLNLPIVQRIIKVWKISRLAKQWSSGRKNAVVITYSLSSIFLLSAWSVKKNNANCIIVSIVPDLPEYMRNTQNKIYWFLKKCDRHIINFCIKRIDGFVLFTEYMKDKLPIGHKPYCVMEGILDVNVTQYMETVKNRACLHRKIIMLSGNLDIEDGVVTLLQAFQEISDHECELWITGSGNAQKIIEEYQLKDSRIKYYGYIASYSEFLKLQQQAMIFALMVPPNHPKSPYYFPSKIMEYLATGGIVTCFKLPCIPCEYDPYLVYLPDDPNNVKGIAQTLTKLCNTSNDDLTSQAIKRLSFITEMKGKSTQSKKILDLIEIIKDTSTCLNSKSKISKENTTS